MDRLINSVPGRVVRKFMEDQAPNWAILIAWNSLFAMFPIILFASALLGFILNLSGNANLKVYDFIFSAIPDPTIQKQLLGAVNGVKSQSGIFFVVGLVGMLWAGSSLFGMMEQAFAVIYHTKPRDFLRQKLIAFAMVFLFTALVGVAVATSAILPALKSIPGIPSFLTSGVAASVLQIILGIVAGVILFTTIYYVIPNRKQEFHRVLPGALTAGVLFEAVTLLFPLYLTLNKGINQYGATFALLFVLMTFFFFIGLITMLGVEVNSVIYPVRVEQPARSETVTAAPKTSGDARRRGGQPAGAGDAPANGKATQNGRHGVPARAALGMAVVASVVGVILGRRSASTD